VHVREQLCPIEGQELEAVEDADADGDDEDQHGDLIERARFDGRVGASVHSVPPYRE
jgi:hypothetical protein